MCVCIYVFHCLRCGIIKLLCLFSDVLGVKISRHEYTLPFDATLHVSWLCASNVISQTQTPNVFPEHLKSVSVQWYKSKSNLSQES